jgi:hypothetical protein
MSSAIEMVVRRLQSGETVPVKKEYLKAVTAAAEARGFSLKSGKDLKNRQRVLVSRIR